MSNTKYNPLLSHARHALRRHMDMQCDPQLVLDLAAERDDLRSEIDRLHKIETIAHAVSDGWKLVPVEPTREMIDAAGGAITTPDSLPPVGTGGWSMNGLAFRSRYKAALAAAPAGQVAQEPVAWQVRNGVVTHGFYRSKAEASEVAFDMQKAHDLGGSLAAFNVRPVYATPPAAEQPDTVTVPRELLERAMYAENGSELIEANRELRALLAEGGVK